MTQDMNLLQPDTSHRIICLKVDKAKGVNLSMNYYEMTRKYWKVDIQRASQATHALAITSGVVKAVFHSLKWYPTKDFMHLGRYEFEGDEDTQSEYLGKSVDHIYGKCLGYVKYINL